MKAIFAENPVGMTYRLRDMNPIQPICRLCSIYNAKAAKERKGIQLSYERYSNRKRDPPRVFKLHRNGEVIETSPYCTFNPEGIEHE